MQFRLQRGERPREQNFVATQNVERERERRREEKRENGNESRNASECTATYFARIPIVIQVYLEALG